jgi:4-amino-4-deoxy-L-arabinose transferase-like glycosyltransferase
VRAGLSLEPPAALPAQRDAPAPGEPRALPFTIRRLDLLLMLLLFVTAIVPRAAWTAYNDRAPQALNDPLFYNFYGDQIADGHGYTRFTGEKYAYYPVGYPATLAALKKAGDIFGWGRSIFSAKMMNGMFGAISVLLLYLIAVRMLDRRVAVAAGLLQSIFPSQIYYGGTILSEAEFTMLLLAAVLVLVWRPWSRDGMPWQQLFAAGLLLSAATMVRGILVVFPLVLLAIWWFYLRSRKRALIQTAILFAGIAVLTVPWSVRNTLAFHTLTGPSTNLGDDLCIGNFNGSNGAFTLRGKCFPDPAGKPPMQVEADRNREGVRIAIHDVLTHPVRMPKLIGEKAWWLVYTDDDGITAAESYGHDVFIPVYRREVLSVAANWIYYATGAIALLGVVAFALGKDLRRAFFLATLGYLVAVPLVFFGDPRFHYPAIPFIVLIATSTIIAIWDRRQRRLPTMERLDDRTS